MDAGYPTPAIEVAEARIAAVLRDPAVRDWLKRLLVEARHLDPVDVAADAELLASLLGDRADALLIDVARRGIGSRA